MSNILEIKNLCKNYDTFALKNVSLNVPKGYVMGFIGKNGAGKTTTIKSVLGIVHADSGTVTISTDEKIGVVMDTPFYCDDWTVNDVERSIAPFYAKWSKTSFETSLKKFNLDRKKKVKELSRGMKVKLMIAVALSQNAELLILDEPTSGLDPVARDEICDILQGFVMDSNKSVLFSTHITADLEKIADYITFIQDGEIAFTGTKDDFLEKYVRVTGGLSDTTAEQKKLIIGYREHKTGFEGMIKVADSARLSKNVLIEPISLDEIIIFMNKGGNINE